jgi:hypothetical protein
MKQSHKQSLHKTLAFAATLAALGVSVGVHTEHALAAQLPAAQDDATPRTRPVELAFTLVEQPGQRQGMADGSKQGMGDGSVKQGAHPGGVNASQLKMDRKTRGSTQGKVRTGASQLKITRQPGSTQGVPAVQLPAVQR